MTKHIKTEITTKQDTAQREILYIASSWKDLLDLPADVQEEFATGLTVARLGNTPPGAKPWKGEGSGVFELIEDHRGDTYRAVYTVRFKRAVYVLHVFKKKSVRGIKTPLPDQRKVSQRLTAAKEDYAKRFGEKD